MTTTTDDRGRLYLPAAVREAHGERYRIVDLPTHVALFPVSEDPLAAIEAEVGDALAGADLEELEREARVKTRQGIATERRAADSETGSN